MFFMTAIFAKEPFSEMFGIQLYQKINTGDLKIKKEDEKINGKDLFYVQIQSAPYDLTIFDDNNLNTGKTYSIIFEEDYTVRGITGFFHAGFDKNVPYTKENIDLLIKKFDKLATAFKNKYNLKLESNGVDAAGALDIITEEYIAKKGNKEYSFLLVIHNDDNMMIWEVILKLNDFISEIDKELIEIESVI